MTACPCDFSSCPSDQKTTSPANSTPSAPAPVALSEAEVKCQSQSSLRFVLTLFESDERAFPEFSYTDLVGKQVRLWFFYLKHGYSSQVSLGYNVVQMSIIIHIIYFVYQSDSIVIKDGAQNTSEEHDIQDHVELAAIARQFEKKYVSECAAVPK